MVPVTFFVTFFLRPSLFPPFSSSGVNHFAELKGRANQLKGRANHLEGRANHLEGRANKLGEWADD
jgi:hypothetical protein